MKGSNSAERDIVSTKNPLALFIRWQASSHLDFGCGFATLCLRFFASLR
jgi:hypothetical protein